ncbi:putative ATP-dependent RNA helicase TDRD12 [Amia ocellicauda]|uniref:putative ATP-dependent RNA helicase TDRD12 n=1 Tax=Amia ocellicauda TaxID=2972642 RepID=UPI003464A993
MLEILILKIEDPDCFWGRILKGVGDEVKNPKEYDDLWVKMNLFYHQVNQDVQKITPTSLEKGQMCVVHSPALKSWCRAFVESLFFSTEGYHVMCFLVDYAEHIIVRSEDIRAPLEKFLHLPFLAKKFRLAHVQPVTLLVDLCNEKAELIPATCWDSSAVQYFQTLAADTTLTEAVQCGLKGDSLAVDLYMTIKNEKICVNDDLVNKKYACFSSMEKTLVSPIPHSGEGTPVLVSCSILPSVDWSSLPPKHMPVSALIPGIVQERDLPQEEQVTVNTKPVDLVVQEKPNEMATVPLKDCDSQCPLSESEPKTVFMLNKNGQGSERATCIPEKHSGLESPEEKLQNKNTSDKEHMETESSLAEELLNTLNCARLLKYLNPKLYLESGTHIRENDGLDNSQENVEDISDKTVISPPIEMIEEMHELRMDDDEPPVLHSFHSSDLSEYLRQGAGCTALPDFVDELSSVRLLQFLNPDPLNPESESVDVTTIPCEPHGSGILVHSAMAIDPFTSLTRAPISENLRKALLRQKFKGPSLAQAYSWPAVARGCDTVLISHNGEDPLTYIPPFLTYLQLSSLQTTLPSRTGPIAVVLCPGWEKAQIVFDMLEENTVSRPLNPMLILVGLGKEEAKNLNIKNTCQVIVTTPFSLVRLFTFHCFLFLRLCHLVFDEVDVLFSRAPEEMAAILQHFRKATTSEERVSSPQQIIAVGNHWSRPIESLVKDYMTDPCVIITVMDEAALYGNVHQVILLCLDCTKISVLLSALDFIPEVCQKTLIFTNTAQEVENVYKAVSNTSSFCMKAHEGLTYQFDFVIEQWKKEMGPGTHIILVLTNDCMKALGIMDATCVVHYGFPSSPKLFGSRLCSMLHNFHNLTDKDPGQKPPRMAKSVLLLSERNARHATGVLRYFERSEATLPPELKHFAQGVLEAKEEQKSDRPLCPYLKSFGFCRERSICPDRHRLSPKEENMHHSNISCISVLPLYIKNASCFFGRIVNRKGDCYESLAVEMAEYYESHKVNAKVLETGELYGIQEESAYHRVRVMSLPEKTDCLFYSVPVSFLDEGRTQDVKAHQLLVLPSQFHSLPPQAVEFIVCRVKPIDNEMEWNPKVSRRISLKIKGVLHEAKVALCLENTVWVDPMVRVTRLPGLKTYVNEYNVRSEILATGMGTDNPGHVEHLKQLCPDRGFTSTERPTMQDTSLCSENHQSNVSRDYKPSLQEIRLQNGLDQSTKANAVTLKKIRYNPELKWFQSEDCVVLNIKLKNPTAQEYVFCRDRVTYSAYVGDKYYYANLELNDNIVEEKCRCEISCNEPVMILVKEKKGVWKKLLKHKAGFYFFL